MKPEKLIPYNFRMPLKLKKDLEQKAKAEKRSLNQQMVVMLEAALAKSKEMAA